MIQVATAARFAAITRPDDLSALIQGLEGTPGAFVVPLYRAALAGDLRVLALLSGGRIPQRFLEHTEPPTVVQISGDPGGGHPTPPPEAFSQARRLLGWAASVMLHATGGRAEHYTAVVEAARLVRRVLLIETGTAQESAWLELIRAEGERRDAAGRRLPTLVLSARVVGGFHPIDGPRC
ncbi:hypothetical protein [Muricoccus radiodurans]|uniref:hypothetical protein n=1 Tax=Muricoccus radiodurans TaxID=2231721 RepID=UPI003CF6A99C